MQFIADFHIHSHFSIATSKQLVPEYLDYWARLKGITVVGSGDFTHPGWLEELKEKLVPAEEGLFKLKDELRLQTPVGGSLPVRFMLTAEISNIYKRDGRVRKVHNVIFAPDFETVEAIQAKLGAIGNITSDGRPILGLDSRDLLEIALEVNENIFFLPAHIWTPWFSALGSKSGFDSIEQCYGDLAGHIYAIETGLSTDAPMNWMCSFLDRFTLLSNSDAHSPEKLGRNANLFDCELAYPAIIQAVKRSDPQNFLGTIDLYPQEGKYHYDGHRKCGIRWDPLETLKHQSLCPVCGKKVTVGVLNRIAGLADRNDLALRPKRRPFHSIIPLKELLSEITGKGGGSKQVTQTYHALISKAGSEFNLLLHFPLADLQTLVNPTLLEAIHRMREGDVYIEEGYDGAYGRIRVFDRQEDKTGDSSQKFLFAALVREKAPTYQARGLLNFDLSEFRRLQEQQILQKDAVPDKIAITEKILELNKQQQAAVQHFRGPALVIAGPGTGKTRVLIRRIAFLINERHVAPQNILAVTFTNKAAAEISRRLKKRLPEKAGKQNVFVTTFHALGLHILQQQNEANFAIIDEHERKSILQTHLRLSAAQAKKISRAITQIKQKVIATEQIKDEYLQRQFVLYSRFMQEQHLYDLDDLIYRPLLLFERDSLLLQTLRRRFGWILVDEYQDINIAQYRLIRHLAGRNEPNLCAIGDPNQAIYGFRGADVSFIYRFVDDFPQARLYRLHKSYRCSQKILKASQEVLTASESALTGLAEGVKIEILQEKTDRSEAEMIARRIEQMMGGLQFFSMDSGITQGHKQQAIESLSDFAVLCRLNQQMPFIEKALNDHHIPFQKITEASFFAKENITAVLDLLQLAHTPDNRYLLNKLTAKEIISMDQVQSLGNRLQAQQTVKAQMESLVRDFFTDHLRLSEIEFGKLLNFAASYGRDWQNFLQNAKLNSGVDLYEKRLEKVTLMTIHASKGLEFKGVFIAGCEQGLLPYTLFAKNKANIEEERRLLYVAMTRAKKYLFLSHAERRFLFGREWQLPRSSFLDKIEQDLIKTTKTVFHKKQKPADNQLNLFDL